MLGRPFVKTSIVCHFESDTKERLIVVMPNGYTSEHSSLDEANAWAAWLALNAHERTLN